MKRLLTLFCLFSWRLYAQTGPGGVGAVGSNSELALWLNADALTNLYDGNNVSQWTDMSGNGRHGSQSGNANKPNFRKSFINGFHAISFNGTTEYLDGSFGIIQAPVSVFTAAYYNQLNQNADDSDYVFSLGNTSASGYNRLSTGRVRGNDVGNADKFINNRADASLIYGDVITGQEWVITGQMYTSASPFATAFLNGNAMSLNGSYTSPFINEGNYAVGRYRNAGVINNSHLMNGYIGEIIVFNKVIGSAERNLITSYLSAKYNSPVANDRYSGDENSNGDHDRDVAGIGRESDGVNNAAMSGSLSMLSESNLDDGDYVMFGHNKLDNSVVTSDANLGALAARWDRIWWIDATDAGATCSVRLQFDFSESILGGAPQNAGNYKLIYRNATTGAWQVAPNSATISNDQIIFTSVLIGALGDGQYTLATADLTSSPLGNAPLSTTSNGPGGIGSTDGSTALTLWLDASKISGSNNDPVITWGDESGHAFDAAAVPNAGNYPTLQTNSVNGRSAINFSVDHYFSGSMGNLDAPATIVAVPYFGQLNQANVDYVIRVGQTGTSNSHTSIARRGSPDLNRYSSWDGAANRLGPTLTGQSWMILSQYLNTTGTFHDLYVDGTRNVPTNFSSAVNTNGAYELARFDGNQHFLLGSIAEIIVFNKVLNAAELMILHSSLAAKYGLNVANDKYSGDTNANGDYDYDVAGVGQSADDGGSAMAGSNTRATSGGLTMESVSNFQNGDFILFGHNVVSNIVNFSDITSSPGGLQGRWERIWYVDVTDAGTTATVDMTFDFSSSGFAAAFAGGMASNYKLLFRTAQSGTWSVLASGSSYVADQLTFSGVSVSQDGYLALGSVDIVSSPLPVELVWFRADLENERAILQWKVATEMNFDRYEIEKSGDGKNFISIGTVKGHNRPGEHVYEFEDERLLAERQYYRLKMIDLDGSREFSEVVSVRFSDKQLLIFPNPTTAVTTIRKRFESTISGEVKDNLGKILTRFTLGPTDHEYTIDLRTQPCGIYLLYVQSENGVRVYKIWKR